MLRWELALPFLRRNVMPKIFLVIAWLLLSVFLTVFAFLSVRVYINCQQWVTVPSGHSCPVFVVFTFLAVFVPSLWNLFGFVF